MTSEDPTLTKTSDITPVTFHQQEFLQWVAAAADPSRPKTQHPVDELLGEHHIMDAALAAMERETRRLSVHKDLRREAWEDIVDFTGNYIYQIHRRKEEDCLFKVYAKVAVDVDPEKVNRISADHSQAAKMTIDLLDGVNEGDWEKVLRAAHLYLRVAREHLIREERDVFGPAREELTHDQAIEIRALFDEAERYGLGDRDRLYYLEVARRMCERSGLTDLLKT